ncbi:DUF3493 domain-containing protein [Acaryochloris sp. IP29b_bin.137]|uniref:DUF3493 domain-containing protein n=1 Tax=Acaryochloris sp. IP29b_bin.137 TaxID=2969217 RepID=UPI002622B14F|nr:DUF3493 domain-containing protein [Acaryochloris sp. IP29b_bin.137]
MSQPPTSKPPRSQLNEDQLKQLRAELKSPYRGLRRFIYIAFAGSAFVGAVVFFFQLLARENVSTALPNLMLQLGILSLMVWLLMRDRANPGT